MINTKFCHAAKGVCMGLLAIASLSSYAEELVTFDPELNEFPESVSADVSGNVYVSLQGSNGEIWRIKPNGEMALHFRLDPLPPEVSLGILGILTDGPGQLFAAVASFDPATSGVWQIKINGKAHRVEGSQNIFAPNDLTFDDDGNIYVTDVIVGAVWRMSPEGHGGYTVQLWVIDPLLAGDGSSGQGIPLGANGIAYHDGRIHVAVTERAHIVSFDVLNDGSAGPADGLQFPTSVTFGSHPTDCNFLYIVNWDVVAPLLGLEPKPALHGFSVPYSGDAKTCNPW